MTYLSNSDWKPFAFDEFDETIPEGVVIGSKKPLKPGQAFVPYNYRGEGDKSFSVNTMGDDGKRRERVFIPIFEDQIVEEKAEIKVEEEFDPEVTFDPQEDDEFVFDEEADETLVELSPPVDAPFVPEEEIPPPPDPAEIEKKAFEEGFAKGEKEGYEAGVKKAEEEGVEKIKVVEAALGEVEKIWTHLVTANEKQLISLVSKIAEQVVGAKVEIEQELVRTTILNAIELIPEPVELTVFVNEEDYSYIETVKSDFFDYIKELKHISVISDVNITRGGCRIESASGEVDGNIKKRIKNVKRSIYDAAGIEMDPE